ncbi:MAG: hypothetical protein AB1896_01175 [Thermodesulfobacteriota bacterium]
MIEVEVRLYYYLRRYQPEGRGDPLRVRLEAGASLGRLQEVLGLPTDLPVVALVNGRRGLPESVLGDGDQVVMFPPVEGG